MVGLFLPLHKNVMMEYFVCCLRLRSLWCVDQQPPEPEPAHRDDNIMDDDEVHLGDLSDHVVEDICSLTN